MGKVISFLVGATGGGALVVQVVVMLVRVGMIVAPLIGTTIWMVVDVVVDGEDLTTEETLLVGVEAGVIVVALTELEHGVIAAAAAVAVAEPGAGVGVGAGAGVVVAAEVGLVAVIVATAAAQVAVAVVVEAVAAAAVPDAATAPAMTSMRDRMEDPLIKKIPQCPNLRLFQSRRCLLCPQAHVIMQLLVRILLQSHQSSKVLKLHILKMT